MSIINNIINNCSASIISIITMATIINNRDTLRDVPMDIFNYVIFPELDSLSIFCLQIVLRHKRIPNKQYFPEHIHELIIRAGFKYFFWFNNYGSFNHTMSMNYAAKYDQTRILQHGHKNDYMFANTAMNNAAQFAQLDCVKLLHRYGLRYSDQTVAAAIRANQLEILQYLISRGCKLSYNVDTIAARNGSLECLKYIRFKQLVAGPTCYITAATHGHIHIMEYLKEHYRPNGVLYDKVIMNNQPTVLRYLLTNYGGDSLMYLSVCEYNRLEMLQILLEEGVVLTADIKQRCCQYILTPEVQQLLLDH